MKTVLHYISLSLIIIAGLLVASCKSKQVDPKELYLKSLSSADTTYVLNQATSCMEELKAGNLDLFVQKLATIDSTGNAVALSHAKAEYLVNMYQNVTISDYVLNAYDFQSPDSNPVRFKVNFGKDPDTGIPFVTGFGLNAVRVGDTWVITLLDR